MTFTNAKNIVLLGIVTLFAIGTLIPHAIAEEYKMVGGITPVLTFTFRDGVETLEFPVFKMGENFVSNIGSTFSVEGIVTNSPLLHQAMDEAYKYRLVSGHGYEYPFKYFDVDVDFVKDNEAVFSLDYNNCKVDNYQVETLDSNDYESYFKEVGFAIVDKIDFECSGVNFDNDAKIMSTNTSFTDYGESGFKFANDMHTSVTFEFDGGIEKIEFPFFELTSGFEESDDNVDVLFEIEGILNQYPLLYDAIDNARRISGTSHGFNTDFESIVEFTNGQQVYRGLDMNDCRVNSFEIKTNTDKEEGFTGKSGFAVVHNIGIACAGMKPVNPAYDSMTDGTPVWDISYLTNTYDEPIQNTEKDLSVFATFTTNTGSETIEFSMFKQSKLLTATVDSGDTTVNDKAAYPTFELRGIVGNYPLLYKIIDDNRKLQGVLGTQSRELVDVDIDIVSGDEVIRGFNYSHCRPIDYMVSTDPNNEESYVKNKFALENIFDFECQGYHPNNPAYDAMFVYEKPDLESTNDLRNTDQWGSGFYIP